MSGQSLSARSVKQMLTRAGVDWRGLTITEEQTTARDAWNGGPWETYTQVRIEGPKLLQNTAWWVLFGKGLAHTGYPEYSLWSKSRRERRTKR